ncbi:Xaa-Pro aminopeptidase [Salsuginibacillus halophilus]|uniref:Xaa-Pro aminopeptidase n=1 Tax=Salsuginibacillus halophilus TaxID=517424 RepID=A0A2P8HAE5_9BACI|nr:Xaa-Pro peptidase family protein [Salsuginibacillus halophilus]PSL43184.1 Xaa-Pro aminopeptidase [Salsuginibacillus halophilus]
MNRLEKIRQKMNEHALDALVIESSANRRYVSGFTGTSGAALITREEAVLVTDFRYTSQAEAQCEGFTVEKQAGGLAEAVGEAVKQRGIQTLGFEKEAVTYAQFEAYQTYIQAELKPVAGIVESVRMIKTDEELAVLKDAAAIADRAFEHIQSFIRPGVEEIEISNELEFFMRRQGAVSSSFDIIVASGYRSALPHGVASTKQIEKGELVTLDFGAYYNGYCSDITRTFAVGEPSEELRRIYDTVHAAQVKALEHLKPGMTGVEADAVARDYIQAEGYGPYFGHGLGHGLGMEVHEGPRLSPKGSQTLEEGMVVTVEPGIYVEGTGGTRIEDDVVITKDGCSRLTTSPKDLIILGE